jgi:3D (Asp-Asp-Asp) domain-containing protein
MGRRGYWITVNATAYSPHDPIDSEYHGRKGARWRWVTADGTTDVRRFPYGIAVPVVHGEPWLPYGTQVIIPVDTEYLAKSFPCESDRVFTVDDTGARITKRSRANGRIWIDLRFKTSASATAWAGGQGFREIDIFVCDD